MVTRYYCHFMIIFPIEKFFRLTFPAVDFYMWDNGVQYFSEKEVHTFYQGLPMGKKCLSSASVSGSISVFGWSQKVFFGDHPNLLDCGKDLFCHHPSQTLDGYWRFSASIQLHYVNIYITFGWWLTVFLWSFNVLTDAETDVDHKGSRIHDYHCSPHQKKTCPGYRVTFIWMHQCNRQLKILLTSSLPLVTVGVIGHSAISLNSLIAMFTGLHTWNVIGLLFRK